MEDTFRGHVGVEVTAEQLSHKSTGFRLWGEEGPSFRA